MEEGEEIVLEGGEGADDDEYEQVLPPSADDHYDLGLANIGYMLIDDTCLSVSYLSSLLPQFPPSLSLRLNPESAPGIREDLTFLRLSRARSQRRPKV